ncbi:hypothetical protein [Halobacterium wangiae]|uniref:hypothetical protein n=1 Tax=Halobacterium wangiae TaxID=2902623 RepID=UPI001E4F1718|nr:hypothetical protein [Halobacterium wangiae]
MTEDSSTEPRDDTGVDPSNVSDPIPEELLEYLNQSIGGNLRSVAHYNRDSAVIETNDDLEDQLSEDRVEEIIDDLRLQDVGRTRQEDLYNVGALYCTLRAFDDALILHFIQGDARGTLVSLNPATAPGLTEFIYDVLNILHTYSDQGISSAPHWSGDAE